MVRWLIFSCSMQLRDYVRIDRAFWAGRFKQFERGGL